MLTEKVLLPLAEAHLRKIQILKKGEKLEDKLNQDTAIVQPHFLSALTRFMPQGLEEIPEKNLDHFIRAILLIVLSETLFFYK